MIPVFDSQIETPTYVVSYNNKTFRITNTGKRVSGFIDELDSLKQTIIIILMTERYKFPIYSWDYGVELVDLIGQDVQYVISELPYRIRDALLQDNRIESVDDFEFEVNGKDLLARFTVYTIYGTLDMELGVNG